MPLARTTNGPVCFRSVCCATALHVIAAMCAVVISCFRFALFALTRSLRRCTLGEAVAGCTQDGDAGPKRTQPRDGRFEEDNRGDDNHDSLHGVGYRVRHGRHLIQRQERDLIVHIVQGP